MKTITVQPLSCQFSNENKKMGLRPHMHYAEVTLSFETTGDLGFPVFADTVAGLHDVLTSLTERPFRDATNEDVADRLFDAFRVLVLRQAPDAHISVDSDPWEAACSALDHWGGDYRLRSLELAVRGVPDDIGHSDGFARYLVTA